jgi:ribosomal protein L11 methyltransferase
VIRLAVRVRRDDAELVLAELLELAPNGVEEVEEADRVEFAVYGAPGELPALPAVEAAAGGALIEVCTDEIPDDWFDGWRRFHRPVVISTLSGTGDRLRVRPPWEPAAGDAGLIDLVIDPGQAFGTGSHQTTRMCLELLAGLEPGGPLVDLGCGSGVLAIAAAKLGWAPVVGVDHEAASVAAAAENAGANGVELDVRRLDLRRDALPAAPTVVANLLRPLLLRVAERMTEPPRTLVASGLLLAEADEVAQAFAARGLAEADRHEAGDWAALLLVAPEVGSSA